MTNGPKITAYGPGSRFGWVHKTLDLEPAVADVRRRPMANDLVRNSSARQRTGCSCSTAPRQSAQATRRQATLDNELVAQTTAWKKGQVIFLPSPRPLHRRHGGSMQSTAHRVAFDHRTEAPAKAGSDGRSGANARLVVAASLVGAVCAEPVHRRRRLSAGQDRNRCRRSAGTSARQPLRGR